METSDAPRTNNSGKTSTNVTKENFKNDINRMIQYSHWLLGFLGIWPLLWTKISVKDKWHSAFFTIICLIGLTFNMIPTTVHTLVREKNPLARLMLLGPVGSCITAVMKYAIMIFRSKTIKSCMRHMELDWVRTTSEEDRAIMAKNVAVGRGLTVICSILIYTGGMSYHTIMPILKGSKIDQFNRTIRPLVYPGFNIFFETQTSPNYEIIFCTICLSAFVRYTVTVAGFNLAAIFVTHACGQIQIVVSRLANLFEGIDDDSKTNELQERISVVVRCHVNGLRLSSRIDDGLREICLIEVMASTLSICLLEYYCMTEWNNSEAVAIVTYFTLLMSFVFNIFIFCHIGELLKEQYHKVGTAAYMMDWYRLPGKHGLSLIMIMAMASYPRKITAGRMMDLSVRSFGTIIKTSVTYLNMLRATTTV